MKFSEIISVSKMPGLFRLVSSRGDGIIVTNLEDNKSTFVSSRMHQVTALENISIFRRNDETTMLKEVMIKMQEDEKNHSVPQSTEKPEVHAAYLESILPDYDKEKVHQSDMKKLVKWYHILKAKDLLPTAEEEKTEEPVMAEAKAEDAPEAKPKKTAEKTKKAPAKKK